MIHIITLLLCTFFYKSPKSQDFMTNRPIDDHATTLGHSNGTGGMFGQACGHHASLTRPLEAHDRPHYYANIFKTEWKSAKTYGNHQKPMGSIENQWKSMKIHRFWCFFHEKVLQTRARAASGSRVIDARCPKKIGMSLSVPVLPETHRTLGENQSVH